MKEQAQLLESIARFQTGFWNRETVDRPPVGVSSDRAWLPIHYLRSPLPAEELQPEDVNREQVRNDYEDCFAHRAVVSDDWMPYAAAWRAVPWLEAMCGCPVRCSAGSLAAHRFIPDAADLRHQPIPSNTAWLERLRDQTAELERTVPADCWISTTILRGASDVLAAMRGLDNFFLDVHDEPRALAEAAARIVRLHRDVLDLHFSQVGPKWGGYGHIFGYWAPGRTTVIQQDALGMCSPALYHDLFLPGDMELVAHLGSYVLFHLHSTGYRHYREVLGIPGLAGLEITVEANGPALADMVPALREILERSRLILSVDGHFDQLPAAIRQLPHEGLYLIVSDRFVPTEEDFRNLLPHLW